MPGLKRWLAAAGLLAMVVAAVDGVGAQETGRPVPAFSLTAPDGRAVSSDALTTEAQWVAVCVRPGGPPADRLLEALAEWQLASEHLRRVVLVVEGTAAQASAFLKGKEGAAAVDVVWYADPSGQAAAAFGVTGSPALLGIRGRTVVWTLDGVLSDPSAYESVVRKWVGALLMGTSS